MAHNKNRPVYLNLMKIRLPIGGVVSILHRITGVLLTVLTPLFLYLLQESLRDPAAFARYANYVASPLGRFAALLALWLLLQHLLSGIRHLLLDLDIGIDRTPARHTAWITLAASAAVIALVGVTL